MLVSLSQALSHPSWWSLGGEVPGEAVQFRCALCSLPDQSDMSFEELLRVQSDARTRVSKKVPGGEKTAKPTKATLKQQQGKKG